MEDVTRSVDPMGRGAEQVKCRRRMRPWCRFCCWFWEGRFMIYMVRFVYMLQRIIYIRDAYIIRLRPLLVFFWLFSLDGGEG